MPASGSGSAQRRTAAAQVLVDDPARPVLRDADMHHLARVLRLRTGEVVVATDGRGRWAQFRYRPTGALEPDGALHDEPAPLPAVTVAFAPAKGDRPEWVVQKLTELGADRIVVLATARSVVRWGPERQQGALERLRRVAREAAAQCRRVWLPDVAGVVGLSSLAGAGMALAEHGGPPISDDVTGVAIGPEGGWAPEELALGWPTVGLGAHVLRAETAAIAAGVLLDARRAGTLRRHGR